ncbi:hypothetical protein Y032_1082g3569 [Ancylostoma ceylanicum]|nr:hypothetical protein Y032_1082g3569 [Ancylostoma ceylanicum]
MSGSRYKRLPIPYSDERLSESDGLLLQAGCAAHAKQTARSKTFHRLRTRTILFRVEDTASLCSAAGQQD